MDIGSILVDAAPKPLQRRPRSNSAPALGHPGALRLKRFHPSLSLPESPQNFSHYRLFLLRSFLSSLWLYFLLECLQALSQGHAHPRQKQRVITRLGLARLSLSLRTGTRLP